MTSVERRAERVAEPADELLELRHLARIGLLVDAVEARAAGCLEVIGHRLVGQQHELFDQPVRDVALGGDDVLDFAGFVHEDFGFRQIEVDGSATLPPEVQNLEQLAHPLEVRHELAILRADGFVTGQDGIDGGVGHARVAVDHAVVKLGARDLAVAGDFHEARLHEAIHVRVERAEARRQRLGEHVNRALREVHRRAAIVGFLVERAALVHVVRDVRDVHAQPVVAVRQPLERDRIVEVPGVLAVDCHGRERPEVRTSFQIPLANDAADALCLRERFVAVRVWQAVLANDDPRVDAGLVDARRGSR